ncbi:hypothetical protein [Aeoliella mucimassa]|uniref:hypothetical protein n=1 Tax=Aeoliella mucimassa TaxID=2527972 RepID=UPI0011AA3709|nr:hypothetical protein [Aeoliella mucimassa]
MLVSVAAEVTPSAPPYAPPRYAPAIPSMVPSPAPQAAPTIAPAVEGRPITLNIGETMFAASTLAVAPAIPTEATEQDSPNTQQIVLEGKACCSIGDGDVLIVADRIQVELQGANVKNVMGLGNCSYVEQNNNGMQASANRIQLHEGGVLLEGKVRLLCSNGSIVEAESIQSQANSSGKQRFRVSDEATITIDD